MYTVLIVLEEKQEINIKQIKTIIKEMSRAYYYLPKSFFKLISEGGSESIGTIINV